MKEKLFRGKTKFNEWIYWNEYGAMVDESGSPKAYNIDMIRIIYVDTARRFIIPETVGQYTGLTDKNGKKIFEGDIVKIDYKYIRYIEYSGECSAFVKFRYIDKLTSEFSGYLGKGYDNYKQTIEIVGNIHDNPELLKGGETNGK